jgi:oxygen-independent coproporphyrinogen-3 oxidase
LTEDWRICEAKCPYCDFNSHVAREIDQNRWKRAYLEEIDRAAETFPSRVLNTVFFGGGTPSLMDPDVVSEVLEKIRASWAVANDLEVTLEANPSSVEADRFKAFRDGGVSRISMGIQALNDQDLNRLGRIHSVKEAYKAFEIARSSFERVSFDLIYARQDQTLDSWKRELNAALSLSVDHLSLYQLTIEPGTAFAQRYDQGGLRGLPDEDLSGDMYDVTQDVCETHGFHGYEVSNHAKVGSESRHNLIYWRYGDYVGIGPGAHGRVTENGIRYATEAYSNPDRWLSAAEANQTLKSKAPLSSLTQANEYLLMSMRLSEGLDLDRYAMLAGQPISAQALTHLKDIGMVEIENQRLRVTRQGRMVLNAVIRELAID